MRTLVLIAFVSVCVFGAWGCGDDEEEPSGGDSQEQSGPSAGGTSGEDETETEAAAGGGGDSGGGAQTLRLSADPGGALAFDKDTLTAKAGNISVVMDNPSELPHAVALSGGGVSESGETVGKGGVSRVSATLEPGEYDYVCPVDGHAEGGMTGTLTVE